MAKKTTTKKKPAKRPASAKPARKKVTKKSPARTASKTSRVAGLPSAPKSKPTRAGETWSFEKTMSELKKLGTEQNRKVYARHGAKEPFFGVSFANQYAIQKKIKRDHDLAMKLWETGNGDAMVLAALIADPAIPTRAEFDRMVRTPNYFMVSTYFARLVAESAHALDCAKAWMRSKEEFVRRAGYDVLSYMLKNGIDVPAAFLRDTLNTIEKEIHSSANRAREGMNFTVIAIGVFRDDLYKDAIAAAKRLGRVEIDHGDTNCKDFIAEHEIEKARAHRAKTSR